MNSSLQRQSAHQREQRRLEGHCCQQLSDAIDEGRHEHPGRTADARLQARRAGRVRPHHCRGRQDRSLQRPQRRADGASQSLGAARRRTRTGHVAVARRQGCSVGRSRAWPWDPRLHADCTRQVHTDCVWRSLGVYIQRRRGSAVVF